MQRNTSIHIESLDFLRGLAALYVLVNHARGAFFIGGEKLVSEVGAGRLGWLDWASLALLQTTSLGQEFVVVFFVISGFAMAHSIASTSDVRLFYLKRVLRIWPPYLLACALAVGLCLVIPKYAGALSPRAILSLVFYLDVHFPFVPQFWSLPHEVLFYAFCPLLLATRARAVTTFAASVGAAAIGVLLFGSRPFATGGLLVTFLTQAMLFFSCGAAFYAVGWAPRATLRSFSLVVAAALAIVLLLKVKFGANLLGDVVMAAATCFAIANLPAYRLPLGRLDFGRFSYSIYIFHYPILIALAAALSSLFGVAAGRIHGYFWWTLVVPPTLIGCYALYLVSERPCNLLLARLRAGRAPASPAPSLAPWRAEPESLAPAPHERPAF